MANTLFQSGAGGGAGLTGFGVESISASGTISSLASGIQYRPVQGDGAPVTVAGALFGTSLEWANGTQIILRGNNDTNTVTINNADVTDGAILNGTVVLGLNDQITLTYDSTLERWVESSRAPVTEIDASNIADGSVSNTEFEYLDGVTSGIQSQLDGKVDEVSSTDNAVTRFDGASGSIQDSGVLIDDSDNVSVPGDLDVDGVLNLEEQSSTPSNPSSGDKKFYPKNDGKLYTLDSNGNEIEVGSGQSSGDVFYINEDFEAGVTNLVAYADAAGTEPVDGTGGSPNITVTGETSNPLIGTRSALITKDAANRQGEGVAILSETIDEAYQESVHTVEFLWKPDSTVVEDALKLFVVHPTTGTVEALYFRNYLGEYTNSLPDDDSRVHRIVAEIAPIDDTYRVAVHVAGTDTTAYTGLIDNIQSGPQRLLNSVYQNVETISLAGSGDFTGGTIKVSRVGDSVLVTANGDITHASNASPDSAAGVLPEWARPSSTTNNIFRTDERIDALTDGTIRLRYASAQTGLTTVATVSYVVDDSIQSTNILGSTQLDQQTIFAKAYLNGAQSLTTGTSFQTIDLDATTVDTHNIFDVANDRFEIPVTGKYRITGQITFASNATGNRSMYINAGGTLYVYHKTAVNGQTTELNSTIEVELEQGDFILLQGWQDSGGTLGLSGGQPRLTWMTVQRIPDYTTIGAIREKNLVQTKTLSADVTSDGTMSDLTFSNLTVGKWYELSGCMDIVVDDSSSDVAAAVDVVHNSTTIHSFNLTLQESTDTDLDRTKAGFSVKFQAEASTVTFDGSSLSSGAKIRGNGARSETYAQIEERNDLRETDKF